MSSSDSEYFLPKAHWYKENPAVYSAEFKADVARCQARDGVSISVYHINLRRWQKQSF